MLSCLAVSILARPQIVAGEISGSSRGLDFTTIQAAINEANAGDIVLVPRGVYYEHIVINKTISLVGEDNVTSIVDGGEGGTVVFVTAADVRIINLTIRNSGWGWTRNGIYVQADNCEISNNYLIHNCHNIRLNYSRNSLVLNNVIDSNGYGIRLLHATECTVIGNKVSHCIGGVHLEFATNCTVKRNSFDSNDQGIRMYSPCTYNTITANNVTNNTYDGMIDNSMNGNGTFYANMIYHNSFVNNSLPFLLRGTGFVWHEGYPQGGNYWSRYNGTDQSSGPYQNVTGQDDIGDTQYTLDAYNIDRYPLMSPWNVSPVLNANTGRSFSSIQEAVDSNTTTDGHVLQVEAGCYFENVNLYKAISLVGEGTSKTFIDGSHRESVMSINVGNASVTGFTIRNSGSSYLDPGMGSGVFLNRTSGCSITHCTLTRNRIGIHVFYSTNATIQYNTVRANNENGIWLWYSGGSRLTGNTISANEFNFGVFGNNRTHFANDVSSSNSVNGKPVRYMIDAKDAVINQADIGVLYLIDCTNMTVLNLNPTCNGHGVYGYNLTSSRIMGVRTAGNNYGVFLQRSGNNVVENCRSMDDWVGFDLQDSDDNRVEDNVAVNCEKGILLYEASGNRIVANTLRSNLYGIRLYSSHSNMIIHNNLLDNLNQAETITSYGNVWDNGCEGNYWSDYNGTDTDGDGVGDTYLQWMGMDSYPLVGPFIAGDVNHDGIINVFDVVKACASYMTTPSDLRWNPHADIVEPYGAIDSFDVVKITLNYAMKWTPP